MQKTKALAPFKRAQKRLVGLIATADQLIESACAFDPWRVASCELDFEEKLRDGSVVPPNELMVSYATAMEMRRQADEEWSGPLLQRPTFQVWAAKKCLKFKAEIEAGDGFAVMEAMAQCISHGLAVPGWLGTAFVERYQRVLSGELKGWEAPEAFGGRVPKGQNLAGIRAVFQFEPWAYEVAINLLVADPEQAIDTYFYEQVGEKISRKSTQVQTLIRRHCKDRFHAPLVFVAEGLRQKKPLELISMQWADAQDAVLHKAAGFEINANGDLIKISPKKKRKN